MVRIFFFALQFLLVFAFPCFASEIKQISKMREIVKDIDENTLVVFDIDETLIMPGSSLLSSTASANNYRAELIKKFANNLQYLDFIASKAWADTRPKLIEEDTPSLIQELFVKKVPMIALTTRQETPYGIIPNMGEYTLNQLRFVGINFSHTFKEWKKFTIENIVPLDSPQPSFNEGVVFTANQEKGPILIAFLDKIKAKPLKVVFIDNKENYLKSVQTELEKRGIQLIGYHYIAAELLPDEFNKGIADLQIQYLVTKDQWLNDEKAQKIRDEDDKFEPSECKSFRQEVNCH